MSVRYLEYREPAPQNNKIDVGDRVQFKDGSYSLTIRADGLKNDHPAMFINSVPKKGKVIALDGVFPADQDYPFPVDPNDTLVACDDGLFIFTRVIFLEKI